MARSLRFGSPGIHHVLNRGVEKRNVFVDRADYLYFLRILKKNSDAFDFRVLSYCLMPNHYHLLVDMKNENLSEAVKSLNQNYAQYFNRKYERVGGLWQGRFKSRCVRDKKYLETLVKYIEQNPIKAGITSKPGEYPWVSALTKDTTLSPEENALLEEFFGTREGTCAGTCAEAEKKEKDREGLSPATTLAQHFREADRLKATIGLWRGKDSRRYSVVRQLGAEKDKAILSALRDGYSAKQISCYLGVSPSAISKRLRSMYGVRPRKLTAVERDDA